MLQTHVHKCMAIPNEISFTNSTMCSFNVAISNDDSYLAQLVLLDMESGYVISVQNFVHR